MSGGRIPPSYHLLILTAAHIQKPWDSKTDSRNGREQQPGLVERTSLTEWELSGNTGSAAKPQKPHVSELLQPTGAHIIFWMMLHVGVLHFRLSYGKYYWLCRTHVVTSKRTLNNNGYRKHGFIYGSITIFWRFHWKNLTVNAGRIETFLRQPLEFSWLF